MLGIWSVIVHRVIAVVKRWDNATGASFRVESRGEEGEEIRNQHFSVLPPAKGWLDHT